MASVRSLSDVPEEYDADTDNTTIAFGMPSARSSATHIARRTSSLRSLAASASDVYPPSASGSTTPSSLAPPDVIPQPQPSAQPSRSSLRRATSTTSTINGSASPGLPGSSGPTLGSSSSNRQPSSSSRHAHVRDRGDVHIPRMRSTPRLVYEKDAETAPSTGMYWSRAPVYGAIPNRTMRAHSVTVVDNVVWLFGGCDERESWKDVYCLDVETMQWTHPECLGDHPPPSRAHSATLVDRKIVFIGGGHGSTYYDSVYILDTLSRKWTKPTIAPGQTPPQRRAHTAVLYGSKIWVFGGGNGMMALADVWTLDVSALVQYGPYGYGYGSHAGQSSYSGTGGGAYGGGAGAGAGSGAVSGSGSGKSITMKWELIETKGVKKPGPRGYHTANLIGNIMVVIGGSDGKDSFDELWTLDLDTLIWIQIKTNMPYKRLAHSSTQVGSYLFIFGGHDSTEYTSELVLLNLVSLQYEARTVYGKVPTPRGYHAAVVADSRLFLIGGFNGLQSFDDVHVLDLAASAYLPQVTSFAIEALVP
ncbi:galactose oxidase [Macrolepiota fuliginosa MF-IS2]|uniref:Galactose oxidase n=1 Tax=Macrolepiota fuliginosa MF-IS2 TaxID=1400762 RepID=A0A9P5X0R3_9AGAR|nr:galactose oxidase [Macrolepiota fuliginosa MF-IS2]